MKLIQTYIPDFSYCIICSKECDNDTCSENCANKLDKITFTIKEKKKSEQFGTRQWDQKTIRDFNKIQSIIG